MSITHASSEPVIGETEWLEDHVIEGDVTTVTSPGAAQTVALDFGVHVIELEDDTETTITGAPAASGYSSALVRLKGSAAGSGSAGWAPGHEPMNPQSTQPLAGSYADFLIDSHDGTSVLVRGTGAGLVAPGTGPAVLTGDDIDSTVQSYDPDTAKRNVAQTWTAQQSFTAITGTAVTVSAPGTAQSVALDGRCHVIELADGINTEITGVPGSDFSNCLVRIKQPAVGSGTLSWAAGHRFMGGSELNTASDSFSDFMLDSHDGSTVLCRGVGVEP